MNNLRNHVNLIGNLGKDIELKTLENGNQFARLSLATSERYKKNDQWVEEIQWHQIVAWGKAAELMEKVLKKGDRVAIQGKLKYNIYTDKEGNKRTQSQVVVNEFMLMGVRKEQMQIAQ